MVQSASGKAVTLADGTTHRRDKILMVPHHTVIAPVAEKNIIKIATRSARTNRFTREKT